MPDAAKLTARVVAAAALAAGLVATSGTAYAADVPSAPATQTGAVVLAPTWDDEHERWHHHDETSNDTSTEVHSSGSGPVAVNSAGAGGYADQKVDQSIHDTSTHTRYRDDSRVDSHDDHNSHNSSDYRQTERR